MKESAGWNFQKFDNWTVSKLYMTNIFAVVMGAVSALSGNDGTFYLYPTFLYYGLGPEVGNATSLLMVFWSKSTSSVAFWIQGNFNIQIIFFDNFF